MSQTRVLHLISGGDTGGAKTHVINLLNGLNGRTEKLMLVTLMESDFTEEAKALEIPLTILHQKTRFDFSVVRKLRALILDNRINLVHVHGARANVVATVLKRTMGGLPMVTTIHSDYRLDDYRGGRLLSMVFRKINERALRSFNDYIGVSDRFRDMMIARGFDEGGHVYAVYNGISFSPIAKPVPRVEFLARYNVPADGDRVYVGIMGRLDPVKNQRLFIEAAGEALKANGHLEFLVAGDGVLKKELEERARELDIGEKIHFLGYVEDPESFYEAIDINVLTSLSESFPYVMLEGARAFRPLVTTNVGGVAKVVENGRTGFVIESRAPQDFAEKILLLAGDGPKREAMGMAIHEVVKSRYSMERFIDEHLRIYRDILDGGSKHEGD